MRTIVGALAFLAVAAPVRARADLAKGLVGYWKLDEVGIGAATVAADSSRFGHMGVYVNAPSSSQDVAPVAYLDARSVAFTRASQQAVRIANMSATLKAAAVTISVWYRSTSADTSRNELVSAGDSYMIYVGNGQLGAGRRDSAAGWSDIVAQVSTVLDGKWHHAAATIDNASLTVFFDGQMAATLQRAGGIVYDLGPDLWFGRFGNGSMPRNFEGNLDEVAIYNRVLASDEIKALATGGLPGAAPMPSGSDGGTDGAPAADAGSGGGAGTGGGAGSGGAAGAGAAAGANGAAGTSGGAGGGAAGAPVVIIQPPPSDPGAAGAGGGTGGGSSSPDAGSSAAAGGYGGLTPGHLHDAPPSCAVAGTSLPSRWRTAALVALAALLARRRPRRR